MMVNLLMYHAGMFNLLLGRFGFCNPRLLSHGITSFQYGPVIKLPLHISQCHMVNHMALTNAKRLLNIDQSDNFDTTISQVFW